MFRFNPFEVEAPETVGKVFADEAHPGRRLHELREAARRFASHFLARPLRRYDLCPFHKRVAVAVVAIVVCVDERPDWRRRNAPEGVEHRARVGKVEHRID
jgi:hypothetical protein